MSALQDMEVATTPEDFKVTNVYEVKEMPNPTLVIRAQSADEEFDYLWSVLNLLPFYKEYGYTFEIPKHPEFKKLVEVADNLDAIDKGPIRKLFVEELYDPEFYKEGLAILEKGRERIESVFPGMVELNAKWGFKLFPQYKLLLTGYGSEGMYHEDTGEIVMMTRKDGTFKRPNAIHTPVHEMVHIGVEQAIVKKFGLTHPEKERLVDLVTLKKFGHLLPGYEVQSIGDSRIEPYITDESLDDLPHAVVTYITDFPRK